MNIPREKIKYTDLQTVMAFLPKNVRNLYMVEKVETLVHFYLIKFRGTTVAAVEVKEDSSIDVEFWSNPEAKKFEEIVKNEYRGRELDFAAFLERKVYVPK